MNALCRVFPYKKSVMLNVLYDTLDSVGFKVKSANSEKGTIMVLSSGPPERNMRIALNSHPLENESTLEIFPDIEDDTGEHLSNMLMDEIMSTIEHSISQLKEMSHQ